MWWPEWSQRLSSSPLLDNYSAYSANSFLNTRLWHPAYVSGTGPASSSPPTYSQSFPLRNTSHLAPPHLPMVMTMTMAHDHWPSSSSTTHPVLENWQCMEAVKLLALTSSPLRVTQTYFMDLHHPRYWMQLILQSLRSSYFISNDSQTFSTVTHLFRMITCEDPQEIMTGGNIIKQQKILTTPGCNLNSHLSWSKFRLLPLLKAYT